MAAYSEIYSSYKNILDVPESFLRCKCGICSKTIRCVDLRRINFLDDIETDLLRVNSASKSSSMEVGVVMQALFKTSNDTLPKIVSLDTTSVNDSTNYCCDSLHSYLPKYGLNEISRFCRYSLHTTEARMSVVASELSELSLLQKECFPSPISFNNSNNSNERVAQDESRSITWNHVVSQPLEESSCGEDTEALQYLSYIKFLLETEEMKLVQLLSSGENIPAQEGKSVRCGNELTKNNKNNKTNKISKDEKSDKSGNTVAGYDALSLWTIPCQKANSLNIFFQDRDGHYVFLDHLSWNCLVFEMDHNPDFLASNCVFFAPVLDAFKIPLGSAGKSLTTQKQLLMSYLPSQLPVVIVEIDVRDLVSSSTYQHFLPQLQHRQQQRLEKKRMLHMKDKQLEKQR